MTNHFPNHPDRHPLDVLAEEFAERYRRGERPSVTDYVNRHPELASGLRQVLPPIAMMEKLKRRNASGNSQVATLKLERVGDFRIVRELGRGGMGIVFEAWQESLGRHVALKVLSRTSLLDPQRLQRFEREARAAAGLHHTNIVPVFGVGEQDGLHYYVMQFIEGRPLSDLLAEYAGQSHPGDPLSAHSHHTLSRAAQALSGNGTASASSSTTPITPPIPPRGRRYWAWVADAGRQVADALQYAHAQGVLHRDIKPANLLLDARGAVWVTDFGLAKLEEVNEVTRTGDVIGTLQYMAPEGLKSVSDARSDVYALGLTLYELLTLKPAFAESSPAALMRRIEDGSAPAPRSINPHIPRDLETIVLKATARDPAQRYATAGALAEDLDNFLHDRPLSARRTSKPERLWRWCRRNRAIASLSALAAAAVIVAMFAGWTAYAMAHRALDAEQARRNAAESAQQKAETAEKLAKESAHQAQVLQQQAQAAERRANANLALSLTSFGEIFNVLAPRDTMPPPAPWGEEGPPPQRPPRQQHDSGQDAAVMTSILNFYDRFAQQNSTNRALEVEAAKSYRRVGDIYLRMGRMTEADTANRRSAQIYDHLLQASPDSADYQAGFTDAAIWIGYPDLPLKPGDQAVLQRSSALAEQLAKNFPHEEEYQVLLSRTLLRAAAGYRKQGQTSAAENLLRRAALVWPASAGQSEGQHRFPSPQPTEKAAILQTLAELLWDAHRADDCKAVLMQVDDELAHDRIGPERGRADLTAAAAVFDRLAKSAALVGNSDLASRSTLRAEQLRNARPGPERRPENGPPDRRGDGPDEGPPDRRFPPPQ